MKANISVDEVKTFALSLGWDDVGLTNPTIPEEDIQAYRTWLEHNHHGEMAYMENDLRCYPEQLLPGAKTAIIFITHYKQPSQPFRSDAGLVASYARGRDYHNVHHKRLKKMIRWLEEKSGQQGIAKGFSDSTPIMEKALAVKAGLGWFGKNTLLIHRRFGTFTLLSGLLTTLEFPTLTPPERLPRCGSCRRCLDACPTQALTPYQLNAHKCLSYHLIESKKEVPSHIAEKNPGYAFGCDICQDACPHNKRPPLSLAPEFQPSQGLGEYLEEDDLLTIEENPTKLFGTPLKRAGIKRLRKTFASHTEQCLMVEKD